MNERKRKIVVVVVTLMISDHYIWFTGSVGVVVSVSVGNS